MYFLSKEFVDLFDFKAKLVFSKLVHIFSVTPILFLHYVIKNR